MFDLKNISQGTWKFLIFVIILVFGFIYFTNGKTEYYAYVFVGIVIIIILFGYSRNPDYILPRTELEARKIGDDYIKKKIEMKNNDYNITLPEGKLEYDGFKRHDEREGFITPFFEMGFHIYDKAKNYPRYYTICIHGLKENLEIMDLGETNKSYSGERYRIKYVLVDATDPEKWSKGSVMVANFNKKEGWE